MTPFFPSADNKTAENLAVKIIRDSAELAGQVHHISQKCITEHLKIINSYYSNRIEGNHTHPADIEKAVNNDYSEEPAKRILQIESRVHVSVQELIGKELKRKNHDICSSEFITLIHRLFYERLPHELRFVHDKEKKEKAEVFPGKLRDREVKVGTHVPPSCTSLAAFLKKFQDVYGLNSLHGLKKILGAAASHHRLLWIHPFPDGNGRIARVFTDTYLSRVLKGYGLWSVSRGLARNRDKYMKNLALADSARHGNSDGRGCLSQKGLDSFCIFFLETCSDQIQFMGKLLDLDGFTDRLKGYVSLRHEKMIPGKKPLRKESFYLLKEAFLRGEFNRGEAGRLTGLPERTARDTLKRLTDESMLKSETPKGKVRLNLPIHVAGYLFPDLFPPYSS